MGKIFLTVRRIFVGQDFDIFHLCFLGHTPSLLTITDFPSETNQIYSNDDNNNNTRWEYFSSPPPILSLYLR